MAIDPRILKIGGDRQVNLNVTPGTVQEPGRTVGGRFQVGAPQQAVGPSGEESLYQSLSYIAGGIVDSAQNISQLAGFNNDILWSKWYDDQWEGPNSKRRSILDDPEISREDKRKKLIELLDAAPSNGANKNRKAQIYGDWLDQDPDSTNLFQADYAKFQEETLTWSPEDRLRRFNTIFRYELQSGMPQAMSLFLGYQKDLQNHQDEIAVTQGQLSLQRTAGFMSDVFNAVVEDELGNPTLLNTLRQEAEASGSIPQLEQVIGQVSLIREKGAQFEVIESTLLDTLNIESNTDRYSPFNHLMRDKISSVAYTLSREMSKKQAESNAKFEELNKQTNRNQFSSTALPKDPTQASVEVSGVLATTNLFDPRDTNESLATITNGIVTTVDNLNMNQQESIDYATDLLIKTWENSTPAQRQTLVAMGLIKLPEGTSEYTTKTLLTQPSFAGLNREEVKEVVSTTLKSNNRFLSAVQRQVSASVAPFINTDITGPAAAAQLPTLLDAISDQVETKETTPERRYIEILRLTHTSNILLGDGGRNVWTYGLAFPAEEYDLYVAANMGDRSPEAVAILKKYGPVENKNKENEGIAGFVSTDDKVGIALNSQINKTLGEIGGIRFESGKQSGVFSPAELKKLTTTGLSARELQSAANTAAQENPQVYNLFQKVNKAANGLTYNNRVGKTVYSFGIPVSYNGLPISNPQVIQAANQAQSEINELKKSNPPLAAARATIAEEEIKTLAVRTIALSGSLEHPGIVGDKPEDKANQQAAVTKTVEAAVAAERDFNLFFKQSNLETGNFYGESPANTNISTVQIVDDSGTLQQDNYARAVFMVNRGFYKMDELRPRLGKAFAEFGSKNGNLAEVSKESQMFLFAVADGIASRAALITRDNPALLQAEIESQIQMMVVGSDIARYAPAIKTLVSLKLADNPDFSKTNGMRFTVSNPDETFSRLTSDKKTTLTSSAEDKKSRMFELQRRLLSGSARLAKEETTLKPTDLSRRTSWSSSKDTTFIATNELVYPFTVGTSRESAADIEARNDGELVLQGWTAAGWQIPGNTTEDKQKAVIQVLASSANIPTFTDKEGNLVVGITTYDDSRNLTNTTLTNENFGFITETLTASLRANPNFARFLSEYRDAFPEDRNLSSVMSYWNDYSNTFYSNTETTIPNYMSYEVGTWWTLNMGSDPEQAVTGTTIKVPTVHNAYVGPLQLVPGSFAPTSRSREKERVEEDIPGNIFKDREEDLPSVVGKESTYGSIWLFGERSRNDEAQIKEDLTKLATSYYGEDLDSVTLANIEDASVRLTEEGKTNRRSRTNAALLLELDNIVKFSGLAEGKQGILPPTLFDVGAGLFSNAPTRSASILSIDFKKDAAVRQMIPDDTGNFTIPAFYGVPFDPQLFPVSTNGNNTIPGTSQLLDMQHQLDFIKTYFVGREGAINFGHPWLSLKESK